MPLTNTQVNQAKPRDKQYKLSDGKGMFLLVHPNGGKYWRLKYRFCGKEKVLALGTYPEVTLKDARALTDKAKAELRQGVDLSEAKQKAKMDARYQEENSFEQIALDWWKQKKGRWTPGHAARVLASLEKEVFPQIGHKAIGEIQPPELLKVVRAIEKRDALDVAGRVLQRCASVFRFAVQSGKTSHNPAAELSGVLKTRKVQHRASLPREELPAFLRSLQAYDGHPLTTFALKLLILTVVRPGELRGARWAEFDLQAKQWRIPADRMKMNAEHIVPLSRQVVDLLEQIRQHSGDYELLFPGERSRRRPISENTMTYAIYRMGYKSRATAHGFRATASSILNEEGFNPDAIERQLAHAERNKVRGAYTHHAEYLKERKQIMQWWADFIDLQAGSNVVPARFGATV